MNTLLELNGRYENAIVDDRRSAGIYFDRPTPTNQTLNFTEGQTPALKAGIYIVEIVNYEFVNCRATFNISSIPGATLNFGLLPNAVTVTETSPGIYQVDNIRNDYDWLVVSAPIFNVPFDFSGAYSVSVTINSSAGPKSYTVSGTVTDVAEWTSTITDFWYTTGQNNVITGSPRLIDVNNPVETWVVTLTPSDPSLVTTLSTSGTGGSSSFNNLTKALTINGTNAQINSHLDTLVYTAPSTAKSHFNIQYRATHLTLGYSDTTFQNIRAQAIRYLSEIIYDLIYDEDTVLSNFGDATPRITDTEYNGTGTYTVTLTPSTAAAITELQSPTGDGTASFNNVTKVLTLAGTKDQVNGRLSYLLINTASDYDQTFQITYTVTTPQGFTASKVQNFFIRDTHAEVSNMNLARSYAYNTAGIIFSADTPAITDLDPDVTTYTITLITTQGQFSAPGTTTGSTWTYTGSRSAINSLFGQITFTPTSGTFQTGTVTYRQVKAGVTQVNTTFSLVGPGIKFDKTTPDNQTVNTTEGATWTQPIGINVIGVEDAITYTIDLNSAAGAASVQWPSLPSGVTASTPSANVYRLSNITTLAQWNAVRYPTIRLNNTYNGTFSYTSTIGWRSNTQSWSTAVAVSDVALMSQPTNVNFFAGRSQSITGYPQITDPGTQSLTYTVTLTPSDPSKVEEITSSATGGTASFDFATRVFTISGTLSQVNARLAAMTIAFATTAETGFYITYAATASSGEGQSRLQTFTKQADFTFTSLGNQAVTVTEGQEHRVIPGYNVTFLNANYYTRLRYVIDVSNIPGAQVIWDTVPSGCVVTNPTTGIYQITYIVNSSIWNTVQNPRVTLRNDISGVYNYTATLTDDVLNYSWSTSLTVNNVDLLTPVTNIVYSGITQAVTGYPQLVDQGNQTPNYTVTVTPSATTAVSSLSTSGSGGTSVFNPTSKVLTIAGTKDQVNSHLASISLTSATNSDATFNLVYFASNNLNSETDTKTQQLTFVTSNLSVTRTYLSNQKNKIFSSSTPVISNEGYESSTYVVTLTASNGQFSSLDNTQDLGTSISISGTRTFVNGRLLEVYFYPTSGYSSNTTFTYTQTRDGTQQISKSIALNYSGAGSLSTQVFVFNNNTTFFTPAEHYLYGGKMDYLLVGAGGGAGYAFSSTLSRQGAYGGGGAGGVVTTGSNIAASSNYYSITVGTAGANATSGSSDGGNGGSSTITLPNSNILATATGGNGGKSTQTTGVFPRPTGRPDGGNNGNFNGGVGGWDNYRDLVTGGGGAGAGLSTGPTIPNNGDGVNAGLNANTYTTGRGGYGYESNISGSTVTYGPGGTGGGYIVNGTINTVAQGEVLSTSSTPGGGANGGVWVGGSSSNTLIPATTAKNGQIIIKFKA